MRHMAYTQNPHMPKVRQAAADMVRKGYTPTEVGGRFGVGSSTVCKWVKKARTYGCHSVPTLSSRPEKHPRQLSDELVWKIFQTRVAVKRSAEVVHHILREEGVSVSLSSVKRTLDRTGLLKKRSPYKRFHPHVPRPLPEAPGSLVQLDTIHTMLDEKKRMYTFTLIDVCSRAAYARTYAKMNAATAVRFVAEAEQVLGFHFDMLQSVLTPVCRSTLLGG